VSSWIVLGGRWPVGALGVVAPTSRMSPEWLATFGPRVRELCRALSFSREADPRG